MLALLDCSNAVSSGGPSEEGMFSDEAGSDDVEGVLVRCGNELEANYYWIWQDDGPSRVFIMPVICVGDSDTPGFEVDDAEPWGDGFFHFPAWDEQIRTQCADACLAAHDPSTEQEPVCDEGPFVMNVAALDWHPEDGPNCDSTVLPLVAQPSAFALEGRH
ncbi:MAG: hypothetical protein HC927_01460 [Deltaproteobacteria bacterium]|nr:hypothetical protein [Deltaproteobacteria bacterium]